MSLPIKSTKVVDGTTTVLHCGIHDTKTEDLAEFYEHLKTDKNKEHLEVGYTPCMVCGQRFSFTEEDRVLSAHVHRKIAMHPDCKKQFLSDIS